MPNELPYFKWYPGDADNDENFRAMSDAEVGFYVRCLNHSWLNNGLPADATERARSLRNPKAYADKQWKRVGRCFEQSLDDSTRLVNRRQEIEREKALAKSKRATDSVRTRYERRPNVAPRALAGAESESGSESVNGKRGREKNLLSRYHDFLAKWQAPSDDDRIFTCNQVDLGFQLWTDLVEKGEIAETNIEEVFEGLERWRRSKQWRVDGYVPSVAAFLGWSKDGRPGSLRWKDRPEPAPERGEF